MEFPGAAERDQLNLVAQQSDDTIIATLSSTDATSTTIAFLSAEHLSLFNSHC